MEMDYDVPSPISIYSLFFDLVFTGDQLEKKEKQLQYYCSTAGKLLFQSRNMYHESSLQIKGILS